jgi:hypothetical protein
VLALQLCFRVGFWDRTIWVRQPLVKACADLGPYALPLLPEILDWVRLEDDLEADPLRRQMQDVVVGLAAHTPAVVARLRELLRDPDAVVRHNAISTLTRIGPGAAAARPELEGLVRHPDARARAAAKRALAAIDVAPGQGGAEELPHE